jgi:Ca-activated chloride channel family protein
MKSQSLIVTGLAIALSAAACAPAAPTQIAGAPSGPSNLGQAPRTLATQVVEGPAPDAAGSTAADQEQPMEEPMPAPIGSAPTAAAPGQPPAVDANTGGYWDQSPAVPDYLVNPFVDAREDNLSTFALDVDTGSYTLARNWIQSGTLPNPAEVRVEEFVNYFEQGYEVPGGQVFGIFADGAPSVYADDGSTIVRIGIQAGAVPEFARKPASLTFVIDGSGSMADRGKLDLVKQSLELLVDRLTPNDTVAIVAYSDTAWVVLEPTSASERGWISYGIQQLTAGGSTNVEAGLRLGYQYANYTYSTDRVNRVILLSDGVANVGATGPGSILESISQYASLGITLSSMGFGLGEYNDALMEQLANQGDGTYAYIDDLDEARRLFVDNLTGTLQVVARDAKIQVDFNPEVVGQYRLIGYENRAIADQDFRNDQVDAGEIGAGHSATALYALRLQPGTSGRIATVQLRWQDPDSGQVREINGNLNTWDIAAGFEQTSPRYQLAVTAAQFAEVLRRSPYVDGWTTRLVNGQAARLAQLLPNDPDVYEFSLLTQQAFGWGW